MPEMSGQLCLGLDIGSSAVKVLLLDDGGWWRLSTFPTPPLENLIQEMNEHLSKWLEPEGLDRVYTIGVCGQGQSAIILDDGNNLLGDIITWQEQPLPSLIEEFDGRFPLQWRIENLGMHLPEGRAWLPVKLRQWALRHPELIGKANVAIQVKDLVNLSLTGIVCSDQRSNRGLISNPELLEWIGLGNILPPMKKPTDIIGKSRNAKVICGACDMSAGLEGLFMGVGIAGNLANTSEHFAIFSNSEIIPEGMTWLPACGLLPAVLYSSTSSGGGAMLEGLNQIEAAPSIADIRACVAWLLENQGNKGEVTFDSDIRGKRGPGAKPRHEGGWSVQHNDATEEQLATALVDGLNDALQPIVDRMGEYNGIHVGGGLADAPVIIQSRQDRWNNVSRRQGKEVSAYGIARLAQKATAPLAVIFGAGKVGRGFLADILFNSGWRVRFVDTSEFVIEELNKMGGHIITRLSTPQIHQRIRHQGATVLDSEQVNQWINEADLIFTAMGGNNLEAWCRKVKSLVKERIQSRPLDIILCENHHAPAQLVKQALNIESPNLGIIQSQILRSCIEPTKQQLNDFGMLTLRVQEHSELPMDGDAAIQTELLRSIQGISLKSNFKLELKRKVFTYNAINAVVSYLGHLKGYEFLSQAANDPEIAALGKQAGLEASAALIKAHGFDEEEQLHWAKRALEKYQDGRIVDPIYRQCRDPMRKLSDNDRLLGPILLCQKYGLECEALKVGVLAVLQYDPDEDESLKDPSISELRNNRSIDLFLKYNISFSSAEKTLYGLLQSPSE
jgi:mannitol-1-phosphate 5-dehydrogenase